MQLKFYSDPTYHRLHPTELPDMVVQDKTNPKTNKIEYYWMFYADNFAIDRWNSLTMHGPYATPQEAIDDARRSIALRYWGIYTDLNGELHQAGPFADEEALVFWTPAIDGQYLTLLGATTDNFGNLKTYQLVQEIK